MKKLVDFCVSRCNDVVIKTKGRKMQDFKETYKPKDESMALFFSGLMMMLCGPVCVAYLLVCALS